MVTTKTCEVCERTFETRIDNAKRCKTCNDRRKRKAESKVTINREQIDAWICRIALPENRFSLWGTGLHADNPCLRAIFKGRDLGLADWQGRLDVYVNQDPHSTPGNKREPQMPKFGRVRLMQVEKAIGETSKLEGKPDIVYPASYKYIAIDYFDNAYGGDIDGTLILVTSRSKYTLKGFGRQYSAGIDTHETIFATTMTARCRSGRISGEQVIAIVSEGQPLYHIHREDNREDVTVYVSEIGREYAPGEETEVEVAQRKQDTPEAGGYPDGMAAAWRLADARDYRDAAE